MVHHLTKILGMFRAKNNPAETADKKSQKPKTKPRKKQTQPADGYTYRRTRERRPWEPTKRQETEKKARGNKQDRGRGPKRAQRGKTKTNKQGTNHGPQRTESTQATGQGHQERKTRTAEAHHRGKTQEPKTSTTTWVKKRGKQKPSNPKQTTL